jgi:hypothetical protein
MEPRKIRSDVGLTGISKTLRHPRESECQSGAFNQSRNGGKYVPELAVRVVDAAGLPTADRQEFPFDL